MSDATKVLLGTQKALARAGETATLARTTTTRDPLNPTKVESVTETYTLTGFIYPERKYLGGVVVSERTMFIPDLLSITDDTDAFVNSVTSVTVFTQIGDVVTIGGKTYRLLENEQPRIGGRQVACVHEAAL